MRPVRQAFIDHQSSPMAISIISYGALLFGAQQSGNIAKNTAIVHRLAELLPLMEVSRAVMETFATSKAAPCSAQAAL